MNRMQKASVTVETALALPIFVCVILTLAFVVQLLRTQETIQQCMTNAANEMALNYYTYAAATRLYERSDGRTALTPGGGSDHGSFRDNLLSLNADITQYNKWDMVWSAYYTYKSTAGGSISNPFWGSEGLSIYKDYFNRNLSYMDTDSDVDGLLRRMKIVGGFDEGFDFSGSYFLEGSDEFEIYLSYRVKLLLPISIFDEVPLSHKVVVRAWGA